MKHPEYLPEFSIKAQAPEKARSACVVVGVTDGSRLSPAAHVLDEASGGYLSAVLKGGDLGAGAGSTLLLQRVPGVAAERVLLVSLGQADELNEKNYRSASAAAWRLLRDGGATDALSCLHEADVPGRDLAWRVEQDTLLAADALYRFDVMKSQAKAPAKALKKISFALPQSAGKAGVERTLAAGRAIALGVAFAKDLGNTPSNVCTPDYLAEQAKNLAKTYGFKCEALDRKACEKLGMGSFLSVGKGSDKPPRFIVLRHDGGKKTQKPYVLVGKAITFDSGGISIKPAAEMDEMNYDMSGGGSVLGTFRAIGELGLKLNVVGLIPACENMPDAAANKPGDVVTSMSGQTIEILNTDAEGRLILCDALTYAQRFKPAAVLDMATLTGACVIALGNHPSGLFSDDEALVAQIQSAADAAWDRVWRLPLWEDYQEQLKSNLADMANIGGRPGGSITAACFLARFAKDYPWAHLDIAGTAYVGGREKKGSTGRPVPLLTHFLMDRAHQA